MEILITYNFLISNFIMKNRFSTTIIDTILVQSQKLISGMHFLN